MRRNKGFTLIEVMVVVAIIAILAAVAIPNYSDYVKRGKIADAISGLSDMRVKMEQYFQDNRTYIGACAAGTVAPLPASTPNFTFACPGANLTATTYTVTANGIGSMAGFSYSITQANARSTTFASPNTWPAGTYGCWSLKRDGSC